ncbi:MAG: hypothetical protein ACLUNO_09620 [Oscillospiraceae bacterium]
MRRTRPLTREQMVTMLYGYASRSEQLTGDDGRAVRLSGSGERVGLGA